jgi:TP901 family phage tail tape measure protein
VAEKLTFTRLIDLIVKTGKIDVKGFEKEYEKAIAQAVARLPAAEAAIGVDLKPKRGFNPQKIQDQFAKALSVASEKGLEGTKAFQQLEKVVAHYQDTLTKLAAVSAGAEFKFSKKFLADVAAVKAGAKDLDSLDTKSLSRYQAYLTGLQKIIAQIEQATLRVNTSITANDFKVAKAEVKAANKAVKDANREYQLASNAIAKIDQTKHKGDFAAATKRLDDADLARINARQRQDAALAALETMEVSKKLIGAHISGFVQNASQNIKQSLDDVNKLLSRKSPAAMQKHAVQEAREAQQISNETLRTRRVAAKNQEKLERPERLREQLELLVAGRTPEQIAALPGNERGLITKAINRYKSGIDAVEGNTRSLLDANYQELMRFANSIAEAKKLLDRNRSKLSTQSDRLQQATAARQLTDALAPQATSRKDLRQEFAAWDRQKLEELKTLVAQERRILDEMVKQGQTDEARLKRLGELKRRIAEAEKKLNSKEAEVSRRDKAAFEFGRAAYKAAGGDINQIPKEARRDVSSYIGQRIAIDQAALDTMILKKGPNHEDVIKAARALEHLRDVQNQLNDVTKRSHPIWHQAGLLLAQFLRYAIGYGVLYKLIQGLQDLGRASIDLQDDLKGIQAITGSTSEEMLSMKAVIEEVATTSAFKIDDIASAVRTVVQAGVDLKDVPKAVKAVSDLATASGTSLQVAADIITTAQAVWDNISPEEIANKVTQAANVSKLAVEDLQSIFNYGASFAESSNINLDQYLNAVAALRNAGRKPSTIGTGLSQLLKELFSPDDKFSQFLSLRYRTVGERVSARQAKNIFSSFTETSDPLQSALQELIRIGANTAEGIVGLQRALDQRSVRAITPLLDNPQALTEINARRATAPTAAEAAAIAMESLKKAAGNLRDELEVLADKGLKDFLPPLTQAINGLSEFARMLGEVVDRARFKTESTGILPGFSAAVAGGLAAQSKVHNPLLKIPAFIGGAFTAGPAGYYTDRALAAEGASDTTRTVADIGLTAAIYAFLPKLFRKIFGSPRLLADGTKEMGGLLPTLWHSVKTGLTGLLSVIRTGLTGLLGGVAARVGIMLAPLLANPLAWVGIGAAAIVGGAAYLANRKRAQPTPPTIDSTEPVLSTEERVDIRARRDLRVSQAPSLYARDYLDQPAPDESIVAQVKARRNEASQFLSVLREGFNIEQNQTIDLDKALGLLRELYAFKGTAEARAALVSRIQSALSGRGPVEREAIKTAETLATAISTGVTGLADKLSRRYLELLKKRADGTLDKEKEGPELQALEAFAASPSSAGLLDAARVGSVRPTLSTLLAALNLTDVARVAGVEVPEQTSQIAKDDITRALRTAAASEGDKQKINTAILQDLVAQETKNRGSAFTLDIAQWLTQALGSKNPQIRSVAASLIDIILAALQAQVSNRRADLEQIGVDAANVSTYNKPITVTGPDGKPLTLTGAQFKQAIDGTVPDALQASNRLLEQFKAAAALPDPAARQAELARLTRESQAFLTRPLQSQVSPTSSKFADLVNAAGAQYGVDPRLIDAIMQAESSYNPNAKSSAGAVGLMQLMPDTAKRFGVVDRFNPAQSIDGGAQYLRFLLDKFGGDVSLAAAGYNAGEGRVERSGNRVPNIPETQEYVKRVLANLKAQPFDLNLTQTGVLTSDDKGRLKVATELEQASNKVAKANTPEYLAELQKKIIPFDSEIAVLEKRISDLNKALAPVSDRKPGDSSTYIESEIAQARARRDLLLTQRQPLIREINLQTAIDQEKIPNPDEEQRLNREDEAAQRKRLADLDLEAFSARFEKIQTNRDFLQARGVTEEELARNQGLPEFRSIQLRLEKRRIEEFDNLEKALKTQIAEREATAQEYLAGGQRELFTQEQASLEQFRSKLAEVQKARVASQQKLRDFDLRDVELAKQTAEVRYQQLTQSQNALAAAGQFTETSSELATTEQRLLDATELLLDERVKQGAISKEVAELEKARLRANFEQARFQARVQNAEVQFQDVQAGRVTFSRAEAAQQGFRLATGGQLGLDEQRRLAADTLVAAPTLFAKLQEERVKAEVKVNSLDENDPGYENAVTNIKNLDNRLFELAKTVGETRAQFEDLNPTLASEFGQVSGQSIAAKIAELPQSLKNLNTNIENRVVTAVDGFADALFDPVQDLIDSIFGLGQSIDELRDEMKEVGDAQLNLSEVQARSVDVAQQIEDIRRNESDPARQEYLINRALQAQRQAEAIAQQQVADAQSQYDQAQFEKSGGGKLLTVAKDLVSGLAEDVFKGTVLGSFTSLFTDAFGGQPKGTRFDPLYVRMSDDLSKLFGSLFGTGGAAGTGNSGSWLSGIGDVFSSLGGSGSQSGGGLGSLFNALSSFGSASSTIPGLSSNAAFAGPPTAGVASGISSAGSFGGAAGAIGGLFTIFSNVMQMLSYKTGGMVRVPAYSTGGTPIATSAQGMVRGPGTPTSDSVRAWVSKDEYILNAKTTAMIGKDTLDAWNFKNQYPMKFSTGGMVSPLQRSVRDARAQDIETAVVNSKPEPVTIRPILVDDHRRVEDFLNTPSGERAMVAFVRKNSLSLRQALS